ncbi:hypothetical protein [Enterococcus sp. HY326]|uniref:hypothetical protein n=1 Tax=Enterococcus sp. HY326 TaxID=2971265 RepID=UPI00223F130A|nr:hypothetical protein [Enterococcus sp. HY326]
MKKIAMGFIVFTGLMLTGCNNQTEKSQAVDSQASSTTSSILESSESTESTSSQQTQETSRTSDTSGNTTESSSIADAVNKFPYAVDLSALASSITFYHGVSVNYPTSFTLDNLMSREPLITITFESPDNTVGASKYQGSITEIPTKEIRIFSAKDDYIRSVFVNTQINLDLHIEGEHDYQEGVNNRPMYLFANADGGYSLATPNYAGNVLEQDQDVMQEVLRA